MKKPKTGYTVIVRKKTERQPFGRISKTWFATRDEARKYADEQAADVNAVFVGIHSNESGYNTTIKLERGK